MSKRSSLDTESEETENNTSTEVSSVSEKSSEPTENNESKPADETKEGSGENTEPQPEPKKERKMGLTRFLQLNPQNSYIVALLNSQYKRAVMTESEWKAKIKEMLERRPSK